MNKPEGYIPRAVNGRYVEQADAENNIDMMNNKFKYNLMLEINVKYFVPGLTPIENIEKGNWIDLRAAETFNLSKGEFALIPLGVAMSIPRGFEVHVAPRSSTFKNYGIIQVNGVGVIDGPDRVTGKGGYCGDNDQWFMPVYATRDTHIGFNDRICQFRVIEQQPALLFNTVSHLGNDDRGGFGSTGVE